MIPYSQAAIHEIIRNRENLKKGIPNEISTGFNKLEEYIDGINQETYYLIAGGTGSGKTKFIDYSFVLKPIEFVQKHSNLPIELNIIYFSLEISGKRKSINLMSYYIFAKYGITLTSSQIRSKRGYILSDRELEMVHEAEVWISKISKYLTIYDTNLNAAKLYAILKQYSEAHGKWTKDQKTGEETFTPHNPYLYTIIIIDHLGNIEDKDKGKKHEIDECSRRLVWFRNKCGFTPVCVTQYNRGMESTERIKFNDLTPKLSDLKETGNPAEDANVVLAIFSPFRFRMEEYRDYNIKKLQDRIRTITLLKNRDGPAEMTLGFAFFGEIGLFAELPRGSDMKEEYYNKVLNYLTEWQQKKAQERMNKLK